MSRMSSESSESSDMIYKTNPVRLLEKTTFTVKGHSFTNPFYDGIFYVVGRVGEVRYQLQKLGGQQSTFYNNEVTHVILPDDVYSWFEVHKEYAVKGVEYWLNIAGLSLTDSLKKILHSAALQSKKIWKAEKVDRWIRFLKLDRNPNHASAKRSHSLSFEENSVYKKMKSDGRFRPISSSHYYAYVCENSGNYKPIISKVYHRKGESESCSEIKLTKFYPKGVQTPFIEPSSISEQQEFDDNESGFTRAKSAATSIHSRKSLPNMILDNTSLIKEASSNRMNTSTLLTPSQSILHAEDKSVQQSSSDDLDLSSVGTIISESATEDEFFGSDELAVGVSRKYHNIATKEGYCELCGERYKDFIKHVNGEEHRCTAEDDLNYKSLDKFIEKARKVLYNERCLANKRLLKETMTSAIESNNENVPPEEKEF